MIVSIADIVLIVIALISGLLALYRGLTREVLSLVAWAMAGGATLYFVLFHKPLAEQLAGSIGAPPVVGMVGIGALIFLIVLVIVHLVTIRISDAILDRQLGMVDRILGFFFGVARGFILFVIPYMFYTAFIEKEEDQFSWIRNSLSLPYVKATSQSIKGMLYRAIEKYYPAATAVDKDASLHLDVPDDTQLLLKSRIHSANGRFVLSDGSHGKFMLKSQRT